MDGRLHVVVSGEYSHENGIPAYGFGEGPGPNGRDWYETETLINTGLHTDGTPQYRNSKHAQAYQYTKYGLITAGRSRASPLTRAASRSTSSMAPTACPTRTPPAR
jgi:hypothetical protein